MNTQYMLWREMQDSIGEASTCPSNIRQMFWKKNLETWEYVTLSLFSLLNNMPPHLFKNWVKLNGMKRYTPAGEPVQNIIALFEHPDMRELPVYNIAMQRYENMNGELMPSSRELGVNALAEQDTIYI